jgi:SAM-dependent methyltransferase
MQCGICQGSARETYLTHDRYRLARCANCGLVYVENFLEGAISYAEDEYFVQRNQYIQRWDEFCSLFEILLGKVRRFKQRGKFLDVGAGVGCLLATAAKRGFDVSGVEISVWASRFAREEKGLNVFTGRLDDAPFENEYFDVIVINHVLEHAEKPSLLLAKAHEILRPDGVLVVGTPNIGSIMAKIKGARWASLLPEQHIWHFSPPTLRKLLIETGFEELHFDAKENHRVVGWGPSSILTRLINALSVLTNRSEAMLFFCSKAGNPVRGRQS